MALRIRMARAGARKRPFYRIVVADSRSPRDGRFLEVVGTYNPMLPRDDQKRVVLNTDRLKHWLGHGAQPSERVQIFLSQVQLAERPPIREQTKRSQPKAKTQERAKVAAEAAAKAAEPAQA